MTSFHRRGDFGHLMREEKSHCQETFIPSRQGMYIKSQYVSRPHQISVFFIATQPPTKPTLIIYMPVARLGGKEIW